MQREEEETSLVSRFFWHFKQTRTYDASNPAESVSIPGGSAERSAEYSALTPRHTAMHAFTHHPGQHDCVRSYTSYIKSDGLL